MLKLYQNIKNRRIELGMTQSELASKMGYADKGMISRVEAGKIDLSLSKIKDFATVLGISAPDLMGWDGNEEQKPLRPNETELLDVFNSVDEDSQKAILDLVKAIKNTMK